MKLCTDIFYLTFRPHSLSLSLGRCWIHPCTRGLQKCPLSRMINFSFSRRIIGTPLNYFLVLCHRSVFILKSFKEKSVSSTNLNSFSLYPMVTCMFPFYYHQQCHAVLSRGQEIELKQLTVFLWNFGVFNSRL